MSETNGQEARRKDRQPPAEPDESRPNHGAGKGVQHARPAVHRRISTMGSGGVHATVVVVARQGKVWLSIDPPFTWEAILEPEKVMELVGILGQAEDDAKRMLLTVVVEKMARPK